jgi:hypothetical protein
MVRRPLVRAQNRRATFVVRMRRSVEPLDLTGLWADGCGPVRTRCRSLRFSLRMCSSCTAGRRGIRFAQIVVVRAGYLRLIWPPLEHRSSYKRLGRPSVGLPFIYGFYGDGHQDKILWLLLGRGSVPAVLGIGRLTHQKEHTLAGAAVERAGP